VAIKSDPVGPVHMIRTSDKIGFAETSLTLLAHLAHDTTCESESHWMRFFELYYPAMLKYAELYCDSANAEDIVQQVLTKLVGVLRHGRYERRDGATFRSYLKRLIRNEFLDWRRHEKTRGLGAKVAYNENELVADMQDAGAILDAEWRIARRAAIVDHVLTRTAMPGLRRLAYAACVLDGRDVSDVAKELGVSRSYVLLSKSRVEKRIREFEAMYEGL